MNDKYAEYRRKLYDLKIEKGEITEVKFLEAVAAPIDNDGSALFPLPERYQVTYKLYPTEESDITCVITLPLVGWNKKFLGTGNGGQAGTIVYPAIDAGVSHGYATANTDMGSSIDSAKMYLAYERWIDFGERATHLMTVVGKQIVEAFYGQPPQRSFFLGGSTGGQQALKEAQMYPEDYDGIVAFCPARNRFALQQSFCWFLKCACSEKESVFTQEQIKAVHARLIERYAVVSGGAEGDNFLSYPGKIDFSVDEIDKIFEGIGLNTAQLRVLKMLHCPPEDTATNQFIFFPTPLGCEDAALILPYIKDGFLQILGFFQRWAFGENCDYLNIDTKEYSRILGPYRQDFDACEPDLHKFKQRGGKLLLITGSNDSLIPYTDGQSYYKDVINAMGGLEKTVDFFRYFHVPGLGHCSGGPGLQEVGSKGGIAAIPYDREHDAVQAVAAWVEQGIAPEVLIASAFVDGDMKKEVDYERSIYPYPYETEYTGGDRKDKNSFRKKLGNGVY